MVETEDARMRQTFPPRDRVAKPGWAGFRWDEGKSLGHGAWGNGLRSVTGFVPFL